MFDSLETIRGFLIREPMPYSIPVNTEQHEADLVGEYEQQCGESLGAQSSMEGGTTFQNIGGERRFSQSMGTFFAAPEWGTKWMRLTSGGDLISPSLLRMYYGRHLKGGKNCPEGSPVKLRLRSTLADRYTELLNKLTKELEGKGLDLAWNDVMEDVEGKVSTPENQAAEQEIALLKGAIMLMEAIVPIVKDFKSDNSQFFMHEILIGTLEDPLRRNLGVKLLNMMKVTSEGKLNLVPRFEELVAAADGKGPRFFQALLKIFMKPGGEDVFFKFFYRLSLEDGSEPDPLFVRLITVAATQDIEGVPMIFVLKTLNMISDEGKRSLAVQLIELLEDPNELEKMRESASPEEYMRDYKARRGSGGGSANGAADPSASPPSTPPSSDEEVISTESYDDPLGKSTAVGWQGNMGVMLPQPGISGMPVFVGAI